MRTIEIDDFCKIGRILLKIGPSDAEFNFLLTGTNENCTTTQKTIKTKKTANKTKTKTVQTFN